jgi:hypothetical protein
LFGIYFSRKRNLKKLRNNKSKSFRPSTLPPVSFLDAERSDAPLKDVFNQSA